MEINHSQPKVFGKIVWKEFHEDAGECNTEIEQKFYCKRTRRRIKTLLCGTCSDHSTKVLASLAPEDYIWSRTTHGNEYAMLYWSWLFHNLHNSHLGKPIFDWEVCFQQYTTEQIKPCTQDCGHDDTSVKELSVTNGNQKRPTARIVSRK